MLYNSLQFLLFYIIVTILYWYAPNQKKLLERIQNHPNLKVEFINVMPVFKQLTNRAYYATDTHWSDFGASTWLQIFNEKLSAVELQTK